MTKREFESLRVGDLVVLNRKCRTNSGIKCRVLNIWNDGGLWVERIEGERDFEGEWSCGPDRDELHYTSVSIV